MSGNAFLPDFVELNELASQSNGGRIIFATDDWFAVAENMILDTEPIFIPDKYTEFGKWMDGWETRRKRIPGHDWCIIKLASPCTLKGCTIDTAFFTGNFAPKISIQGALLTDKDEKLFPKRVSEMGSACSDEELQAVGQLKSSEWIELIKRTELSPGYEDTRKTFISIDSNQVCSHIRVNIYPDGGIARLRCYGEVKPNIVRLKQQNIFDLLAVENGAKCLSYSNAHYGHPRNLIKPGRGINMGDGWETSRRLDRPAILTVDDNGVLQVPGFEWAIFQLYHTGVIDNFIVDTCHFKGNFPDVVRIEACLFVGKDFTDLNSARWTEILSNKKLAAHKEHHFKVGNNNGPFNLLKIIIAPDGGLSRVRAFGNFA